MRSYDDWKCENTDDCDAPEFVSDQDYPSCARPEYIVDRRDDDGEPVCLEMDVAELTKKELIWFRSWGTDAQKAWARYWLAVEVPSMPAIYKRRAMLEVA